MSDCISSESATHFCRRLDNDATQSTHSNDFVASQIVAHENGADELKRATPLKLLLQELEMLGATRQQLHRIDRHIAKLGDLISAQVAMVEKDKLKGRKAEPTQNLLATLNDLLVTYQLRRRRIRATLTG